ncbi:hypothetical protein L0Y49_02990, partial [bacterium]|nr:hypothetical protein [bacterium]MCI0566222.1 hypothetical protein [bacterium]MCI0679808.1 hypothetical protein [bacterium]
MKSLHFGFPDLSWENVNKIYSHVLEAWEQTHGFAFPVECESSAASNGKIPGFSADFTDETHISMAYDIVVEIVFALMREHHIVLVNEMGGYPIAIPPLPYQVERVMH